MENFMDKKNSLLLKDLLREAKENRINLMRISTLMEKILPEVTAPQSKKLTEMFTEVSMMVTHLNSLPYTKFNVTEWQILIATTYAKITELRETVGKISEENTSINCKPLIKALDEVFIY
jgi:hypothetical protein